MVNVSHGVINYFNEGNLQTAAIEFSNGKESFTITEADIIQGGLKIDRYCSTTGKIEIGSAVASELSLKLRNYDGKFDNVSFEGAVLYVKIGVWSDDPSALNHFILGQSVLGAINGIGNFILGKNLIGDAGTKASIVWIPCGRFIIDTSPRKLQIINISALDYMVRFDKVVDTSELSFPIHVDTLIQKICNICNVTLSTDVTALPNHKFSIGKFSSSQQLTYRLLLQWCAQITGTCAFMNEEGLLILKWYEQTSVTITANERYSSDMLENDITITGFSYTTSNSSIYLAGIDEYALDLSDCGLLTNSQKGVLNELYSARGGFTYRPYSAIIKSAPYLFPMDMLYYKDKLGVVHNTIVTNVTLSLNCNTTIAGAGETVTKSSYVQSNSGITAQQATVNTTTIQQSDYTSEAIVRKIEEYPDGVDAKVLQSDTIAVQKIKSGQIMVKIWENTSPNSVFSEQTIVLENSAWSQVMFVFNGAKSETSVPYITYTIPCIDKTSSSLSENYYSGSVIAPISESNTFDSSTAPLIARRLFSAWNKSDLQSGGNQTYFHFQDAMLLFFNGTSSTPSDISNGKKYSDRLVNEYMIPVAAYGIK